MMAEWAGSVPQMPHEREKKACNRKCAGIDRADFGVTTSAQRSGSKALVRSHRLTTATENLRRI